MKWTRCTTLPDHDRTVIVTDAWGETFHRNYVATHGDGSRGWACDLGKPHHFIWTELVLPDDAWWKSSDPD
jgi:hypothetical protein